jgi:hypothetical protein
MAYRVGNENKEEPGAIWQKEVEELRWRFFFFKSFLRVSKRTKGRQSSNQSWSDDDGGGSSDQDIYICTVYCWAVDGSSAHLDHHGFGSFIVLSFSVAPIFLIRNCRPSMKTLFLSSVDICQWHNNSQSTDRQKREKNQNPKKNWSECATHRHHAPSASDIGRRAVSFSSSALRRLLLGIYRVGNQMDQSHSLGGILFHYIHMNNFSISRNRPTHTDHQDTTESQPGPNSFVKSFPTRVDRSEKVKTE